MDSDEYGNPRPGQPATRYGWLGAKQRSTETPTGMTLMGVRLYNPTTGRFLSVDPVYGGGANAYAYPGDPVNQYDLDGRSWWRKAGKWAWKNKWGIAATALSFAPGGQIITAARFGYTAYRAYRLAKTAKFASKALRSGRYGGMSYRYGNFSVANYGRAKNAFYKGQQSGRWNHQGRRVKIGWNYNRFAGRPTFRIGWRFRNKPRHFTLF
ncbi:RHS repeat-associated core domain-containing protein [Streptomyces sp. NPDC057545]|uniref:RHS repeat-associated core domain-containing protein n=1 Tax=unclassified Streptomyces TaxID=2593676 RepID=UPI0036B00B8C